MGVEPYDEAALLADWYGPLAEALGDELGCKVELTVATNYTAEVEAMRAGKLEVGEFGPLGYVLASKEAKAKALASFGNDGVPATYTASVVTWPGSGVTELEDCAGRSFGYSDPASTSGHLFPAYALKDAGIDPDKGVKGLYAGSHTASFEALRNHKVDCGELNSQTVATATTAGTYEKSDYTTLWTSDPIPLDPIAVRKDLPEAFQAKLAKALTSIDVASLSSAAELKDAAGGDQLVTQTDDAYDQIRDLAKVLDLDLTKVEG
jgi:phosphonate transport system substrate-binding protein